MAKISKVVYGGQTLIDLTADTIKPDKLLKDYTAHGADGEQIVGTCTFDADTQDATATEDEILSGKRAYNKGVAIDGKMKNNGAVSIKITDKNQKVPVDQGYHDGSGTAEIDDTEKAKLIPGNIRAGITLLGVSGTGSGEPPNIQPLTVTENGTYTVSGDVDGYSPVEVEVPEKEPVLQELRVTANGTYTAPEGVDGYSPVTVNVPSSGGGGFEPSALLDHGYGNATFIPFSDYTIPAGGKYDFVGADNTLPTTHTDAVGYIYGHPEITARQKRSNKWSYLSNVWNCSTTDFTFKGGESYTFVYINNPNE